MHQPKLGTADRQWEKASTLGLPSSWTAQRRVCCDAERPGRGRWHLSPLWSICAQSPNQLPTHTPGPEPAGSTQCTQHPSSPARPLYPRVLTHMSVLSPFLPPMSTTDTEWTLTGWAYWAPGCNSKEQHWVVPTAEAIPSFSDHHSLTRPTAMQGRRQHPPPGCRQAGTPAWHQAHRQHMAATAVLSRVLPTATLP